MSVVLTEFQCLTTALYPTNDIKVRINYRLQCSGWMCNVGWIVRITGTLDGQTLRDPYILTSIGGYGGQDNAQLLFTGKMPERNLQGEIIFELGRWGEQGEIARESMIILNAADSGYLFICPYCKEAFLTEALLNAHITSVHDGKPPDGEPSKFPWVWVAAGGIFVAVVGGLLLTKPKRKVEK